MKQLLKKKVEEADELRINLEKREAEVCKLTEELCTLRNKMEELKENCCHLDFLTKDQKTYAHRKSMQGHKWSNTTIKRALQLRFACGTSGYETLLQHGYPLPAIRTLQKRTEHINFESGISFPFMNYRSYSTTQGSCKKQPKR